MPVDVAALRALALNAAMFGCGVSATVTPVNGAAISTTGVWIRMPDEDDPVGHDRPRLDPRRIMVFSRAEVPNLPRGSSVSAPPPGGTTAATWTVENIERQEGDQVRAILRKVPGV